MWKGRSNPQRFYLLTLLTLGCGSFAVLVSAARAAPASPFFLLGIALAFIVTSSFGVRVETSTPNSVVIFNVSDGIFVFALLIAGASSIFPLLVGSLVVRYQRFKGKQPLGYLFTLSEIAMTCCVLLAALSAIGITGPLLFAGLAGVLKMVGFVLAYLIWDTGFFSLLISIGSGEPALQVYHNQFQHITWIKIIPTAMGVLGAMVFAIDPWLVLPAVVPLALAYRAIARLANVNRELEERVAARTADLQQALRAKDDFVAIAAHELRTPLTSITGALSLVIDAAVADLPLRIVRLVQVALTSSERLTRLVNQMLDLQKLEAGALEFDLQPVNLIAIVDQAIAANAGYATTCGVTLRVDHTVLSAPVLADSDRLIQVLTNLLSNACKFSPPGGEVLVTVTAQAEAVRVSVCDHGPGIPEAFRQHVFEKFAQANTATNRQKGGTGLGLSITKAIVEQLGGQLGFETETNIGTTFFFDLPCLPSDNVSATIDRGLLSGNGVSISRGGA